MPRSFSSRTVAPSSPRLVRAAPRFLPLALAVVFLLPPDHEAEAQVFIDDGEIKRSMRASLEDLLDNAAPPSGEMIRKQLRGEFPDENLDVFPTPVPEDSEPIPLAELYRRLRESTVAIGYLYRDDVSDPWEQGVAGGVILAPDGLVLTNHHVLATRNARVFGAMTFDRQFFSLRRVRRASKQHDLALVELDGAAGLSWSRLAPESAVGDPVYSVSHPDFHYYTFGEGRITRFYLTADDRIPRAQVNLNFAVGSSGAGVFSPRGRLAGLITSTKSVYYRRQPTRREARPLSGAPASGAEIRHLQMVIRSAVPLTTLREFLEVDIATGEDRALPGRGSAGRGSAGE